MQFERSGHEILTVETVVTPSQTAIVKKHYSMYVHVELTMPAEAEVGKQITGHVRLARWDDSSTVTDYTPLLTVNVDGEAVAEIDPTGGEADFELVFTDAGMHEVTVGCPTVLSASMDVVVS